MENAEKRLIQTRTVWKSGRLGNGRILEWKPFLVGFRLEFDGVAGGGITTRVKKYLLHKCIVGWIAVRSIFDVPKSISISPVRSCVQQLHQE